MLTNNLFHSFRIGLFSVLFFLIQSSAFARSVDVMDNGLNMLRATTEIPNGWKLETDIASNPVTGQYVRFKHDVIGPNGEVLRELPPVYYGMLTGRSFQQTWQLIINEATADFMDVQSVGRLIQDGPVSKQLFKALNVTPEKNAQKGIFEVTVTGQNNNQPYSALLIFTSLAFDGQSGMMYAGILGSPTKRLDATIATSIDITRKTKMSPQYDKYRASLIDQGTRMAATQHKQRMQNNQQLFNQHQQMIGERSQMADQQHQQWMNDNFNNNVSGSGSQGYSGQNAYIDSIHESSTFADPSTGQNRTLDGQYQYNYTDGTGNYYGTDNPSFNPQTMPGGDWQVTQPLQPQY